MVRAILGWVVAAWWVLTLSGGSHCVVPSHGIRKCWWKPMEEQPVWEPSMGWAWRG